MSFYGWLLLAGGQVSADVHAGLFWLELARTRGEPQASVQLGIAYLNGMPGVDRDVQKGLALLEEAHDKGLVQGLWALTKFYFDSGDRGHLYPLLLEGVTRLYGPSMSLMAWELNGQVPPPTNSSRFRSDNAWLDLFLRGTLCNNPTTETYAAVHLSQQKPADWPASRLLLRRAAAAGCVEAQAIVASALVTGAFDITPDVDRGVANLERLVKVQPNAVQLDQTIEPRIGRAEAQWQLGRLLYEGKYISADPRRGQDLIEQAAAEHNPSALQWLASAQERQKI